LPKKLLLGAFEVDKNELSLISNEIKDRNKTTPSPKKINDKINLTDFKIFSFQISGT